MTILASLGIAILLLLIFGLFHYILRPYYRYIQYKTKSIPGEFHPVLGFIKHLQNSFAKTGDCWGYYKTLPKYDPNARAHVANMGTHIVLQLLDPKLIKEFYNQQQRYIKVSFSKAFQALVGTGLLRAEGRVWKHHRKLLSNMFHFEFLKENLPLVVKTTREFLDELKKSGKLKEVNIMDEIQKITGEIVGRIFFGENLNKYSMNGQLLTLYLAELLVDIFLNHRKIKMVILRLTGLSPYLSSNFREIMKKVEALRSVCLKIINDRKNSNIKAHDMLGSLLETQKNPNQDEVFSDEDIVNEFITFFAAGMDTTGHSITMALYLLDKSPRYKEDLKNEIKTIYEKESIPSQDSLGQMEFAHSVLKETLRMYSPAPGISSRIAQEDHNLLDIKINKGMRVRPNPIFNYFHPKYFENPDDFLPERWLSKSSSTDPFVYIPFSAGSRNCIGQHLSITESKVILAEFFKRFDFEVPKDYKLRMTMGFLYEPAEKINLKLIPK